MLMWGNAGMVFDADRPHAGPSRQQGLGVQLRVDGRCFGLPLGFVCPGRRREPVPVRVPGPLLRGVIPGAAGVGLWLRM
jgi:hypothetical protein